MRWIAAIAALAVAAAPAAAEVAGRVVGEDERPVAEARVELMAAAGGAGAVAWTDAAGAFAFPDAVPPAEVRVSHPGFLPARFAVEAGAGPLVLAARREVADAIEVSAELGRGIAVPPTLSIVTL
ncbi:MAG TPA: carboxypeptidase-like regulatory domain-containing protein, partial [Thermoanaerobaculia bacterium]|nr:carboxypeptidase-like regulatory domain-containing protein [Thermoanaerobaculia bacterium]